jgi:hypothetical protein
MDKIEVNISDMKDSSDVRSIDELHRILSRRYNDGVNSFTLTPIESELPCLTVIIKNDLGTLIYIENYEHPGFVPENSANGLEPSGKTVLYYGGPTEIHETLNRQIVSSATALRAAEEFALTPTLPSSVTWTEL